MIPGVVAGFPARTVQVPSAPTGLARVSTDRDPLLYYVFSWSQPQSGSPPLGYRVYMRSNGGAYAVQAQATSTSVRVDGVSDGVTQDFYVAAWNSAGEGPPSNVVNIAPS